MATISVRPGMLIASAPITMAQSITIAVHLHTQVITRVVISRGSTVSYHGLLYPSRLTTRLLGICDRRRPSPPPPSPPPTPPTVMPSSKVAPSPPPSQRDEGVVGAAKVHGKKAAAKKKQSVAGPSGGAPAPAKLKRDEDPYGDPDAYPRGLAIGPAQFVEFHERADESLTLSHFSDCSRRCCRASRSSASSGWCSSTR